MSIAPHRALGRIVALGAAAVMALSLTACATSGGGDDDTIRIGLAVPNQEAQFFVTIREAVEEAAGDQDIEIIFADAKNDADAQVSQIQDFITQGVDAIIYTPAGATAAAVPVREAKAAGIPIVSVDRNPEGAPGDTFIATDSVAATEALGQWVVEQTGGKADLGIVQGSLGTTPMEQRTEGFAKGIAGSDVVEVAAQPSDNWLQQEGFDIATDMLQAHPEISVIFGQGDALAIGASQAAGNAGLNDILFVGFDGNEEGLKAILAGTIDATITQPTNKIGTLALESAVKLINGDDVPAEQILEGVLTTKDNAQEFIENHP